MKSLPILTNSSITTFRRCPREYKYRYALLRKPKAKAEALRFGSFFHVGLNAWWRLTEAEPAERLDRAMCAIKDRAHASELDKDPFELVKAERLLAGYTARWGDEGYTTIAVERNFRLDQASFELAGSIDAVAKDSKGIVHLIEHKTTKADISPGSDYWRHVVALDPQVSTYMAAAKVLGYDPRDTVYDVIRKPSIQPLHATPEEIRKYTIPTKKDPIPRLYKNHREADETPEEYGERLTAYITARPDWYYQRMTIVRLEHDNEEYARDVEHTAAAIIFAEDRDAWPRSPNACSRWGRLCDFMPVCEGQASIDGPMYEAKTRQHEELEI